MTVFIEFEVFDVNDNGPQMPIEAMLTLEAFMLCVGSFLLYSGIRRRVREVLRLTTENVEYDSGPTPLPLPLMLWFGPVFMFGPQIFAGQGMPPVHTFWKKYSCSVAGISRFVLERAGGRQRLTVDFGANRFEIGDMLREPEREWLAEQLDEWLSSTKSGSQNTEPEYLPQSRPVIGTD